jgi:hypothetical protein
MLQTLYCRLCAIYNIRLWKSAANGTSKDINRLFVPDWKYAGDKCTASGNLFEPLLKFVGMLLYVNHFKLNGL